MRRFLTDLLIYASVSREVTESDASKMEHDIRDESFRKLKETYEQ